MIKYSLCPVCKSKYSFEHCVYNENFEDINEIELMKCSICGYTEEC